MRTFFKGLFFLVIPLMFVKCGGNDPEAVAEEFLTHLSNQEWSEAQKLMTTETAPMMTMIQGMAEMSGENLELPSDFKIVGCEVDGETAVCTYTAEGGNETLNLKKEDGEWKVAITKQ